MLWRGRGTANKTLVCGEHLQWMDHTGAATAQGSMCLPSPSCSGSRVHCEGTVPVGCAFPQGSWSQAVTLPADGNHPGSQEDVVSGWQPAQCLLGNMVPGAEIAVVPCLSPLAVLHLSLCLQGEPQTAAPL